MKFNLKSFIHNDWVKIYDGRWSFLTSTHFINQYTKELIFGGHPFKSQSIIFISHGRSAGWMRQTDRDRLGKYLANQIEKNPRHALVIARRLKQQAKSFLKFINAHESSKPTLKLYFTFWKKLLAYYHPHINIKYVVDYLQPNLLKKYLPALQSARLAAEPVLNRTEDFMISFTKLLGKKIKYKYNLLLCLTKEELAEYFNTAKLPKIEELNKRDKKAILLATKVGYEFYTDQTIKKVESLLVSKQNLKELKGSVAYPGKIVGKVKIVINPKKATDFKVGDILVTGATRPEFLPIMHKAAAFVTDAGGILSHAAITAREIKKPCIIGTKIATKVLKDGDIIEVDANKGIITKIK